MQVAQARVTVLVADDHPVYREGVALAIRNRAEFELVGAYEDGREALTAIEELQPQIAVLDVQMPRLSGIDVLNAIQRDGHPTRVVLVSAHLESSAVYEAVSRGAGAYLSKDATRDQICDAVAAVARGEVVLDPQVQAGLAAQVVSRERSGRMVLSPRELEVLRLTAAGMSGPQIGRHLHLSPATVKTHLKSLYEKLGVSDRAAAVAEGMRRGLVE